jgi:TPP-dependent pyruvate/acetoin dehydrogenase alpha subunit
LPVIFFCENNLYGEGTHIDRCTPIKDLAIRADGYGIPGVIIDGNDILAVYEAVSQAAERARSDKGATFIEAKTYRQRGHYEGDPQVYRTQEEIKKWKRHDPILLFKSDLIESGLIDEGDLEEIQGEVITQLDQAVGFAADAPKPEPEDARAGVYDNIHDGLVF